MKINSAGLDLIMKWESLQLKAYLCPAGIPTIGYGHTDDVTIYDVKSERTITEHQADVILQQDLEKFETAVEKAAPDLNTNQFSALVSFAFNVGVVAFEKSTLLKFAKRRQFKNAAGEFSRWVYGGRDAKGELIKLPGLVKRRADERALFEQVVYEA